MIRRIEDLPNLGPFMARKLADIGIMNEAELRTLGAVGAYWRLKFQFGNEITLNALWAMDAALSGIDWRDVSALRKRQLRAALARD